MNAPAAPINGGGDRSPRSLSSTPAREAHGSSPKIGTGTADRIRVSMFERLTAPNDPKHTTAAAVLALVGTGTIKQDGDLKAEVERIRRAPDKDTRNDRKRRLPLVAWSGTFDRRANDAMREHSGLLCLDVDNVPADALAGERARIEADPHTFACFLSPSGNGLKVLVRCGTDKEGHRRAYAAAVDHYGGPYMDKGTNDPARACFLSFDPDLYVNEDAAVFTVPASAPAPAATPPATPPAASAPPAAPVLTDADIDAIAKRTVKRMAPDPIPSGTVLSGLLEKIAPVDFRQKAGLAPDAKVKQAQQLVCIIWEVLEKGEANGWGLCYSGANTFAYNGRHWEGVDERKLRQFLGDAAARMGVAPVDAAGADFQERLFRQFMAAAHPPDPGHARGKVLVNLLNGTLEISAARLRLRPARSGDFLTHVLPFAFDPKATAPMWQKFLDRVQPDPTRQQVLAEAVANVFIDPKVLKLEKVPLLHGSGANGKSVFCDVVTAMLGEENVTAYSLGELTDEKGYHRAALEGKLLNLAAENGGKMSPEILKTMASGEPLSCRHPGGRAFMLRRYPRLMFSTNVLPHNVEHTDGFFRRFLVIPFDVTIPEEERDRELAARIIESELPGILNWTMAGFRRLLKQKSFTRSQAVDDALRAFRVNTDSVRSFMEEEGYRPSVDHHRPMQDVFQVYRAWCRDGGLHPVGSKQFRPRLESAGFRVARTGGVRVVWLEKSTGDDEPAPF